MDSSVRLKKSQHEINKTWPFRLMHFYRHFCCFTRMLKSIRWNFYVNGSTMRRECAATTIVPHHTKAFITTATLLRCWALRTHKPGSVSLFLTDADGREIHWSTKLSFLYHCFIDSKIWNNFHATSNRPDFFGKSNLKCTKELNFRTISWN